MTITEQTPVGELAATVPASVRVFRRHGLDFCCGGRKALAAACDEAGLSVDAITREIEAEMQGAGPDQRDWMTEPLPAIIDHIVTTFHDPLRSELPDLQALAAKVARAHGAHSSIPNRLVTILDELTADLLAHMRKEEIVLFPAIRQIETGQPAPAWLAAPISVMEAEHDGAAELLRELRTVTEDYVPPAWACATVRALYEGLDQLEQTMHLHVHLENNILFPRALGHEPVQRASFEG
jgi:regulator of cell morphogenesis and NO signaling